MRPLLDRSFGARALTRSYSQLVDPRLHQLGAFSLLDTTTSASRPTNRLTPIFIPLRPSCSILTSDLQPFVSPFLLGYMIEKTNFKDVYLVGVGYTALVVLLIAFFAQETMYDRDVVPFPERPTTGLRYRVETLIGITGVKMAKYVLARPSQVRPSQGRPR